MAEIRWILLGLGVVLLIGIWWWGSRRPTRAVANDAQRAAGGAEYAAPAPRAPTARFDESDFAPPSSLRHSDAVEPLAPLKIHAADHSTESFDWPILLEPEVDAAKDLCEGEAVAPAVSAAPHVWEREYDVEATTHIESEELSYSLDPAEIEKPIEEPDSVGQSEPEPADGKRLAAKTSVPESDRADRTDVSGRFSRAAAPPPKPVASQCIITVRIHAPAAAPWTGDVLLDALLKADLAHGRYGIFHRLHGGQSVFSVASFNEPGTFVLESINAQPHRGVTLFAVLPGPAPPSYALQEMLDCAGSLARQLEGLLQDESGQPLAAQEVNQMRERVAKFEDELRETAS